MYENAFMHLLHTVYCMVYMSLYANDKIYIFIYCMNKNSTFMACRF